MATQTAVSTTSAPQQTPSAVSSTMASSEGGFWKSALQLISLAAPNIGKDSEFSFQFLTSPQRAKPAASVNADNFYMYACGSINMP